MFDNKYVEWNYKRIKGIMDFYGHKFFFYKKILDLGCGHADISGVFYRLGAHVTAVDARQEHLKIVNKKYTGIQTLKYDLDQKWPFNNKIFDIVFDLDLIPYINNFETHLRNVCRSTTHLVLETAVCDSSDPFKMAISAEDKFAYDLSFNGSGCRPTAATVERILTECGMNFKRQDLNRYNSGSYQYDWIPENNNECNINKRRLWFAVKNTNAIQFAPPKEIITSAVVPNNKPNIILPKTVNKTQKLQTYHISNDNINNVKNEISDCKIRLFYNYYKDKDHKRRKEIDFCLEKNINNPLFDIIILESETNPTFNFYIEKINKLSKENDINIICNSDIFFDKTIELIKNIKEKDFYALSRYDWDNNLATFSNQSNSQDVWIFKGRAENINADFQLGKPGCDNRIAFEFKKAGYNVTNPSKSIKTYHVHSSNIRRYSEEEKIEGEYLFVEPSNI